MAITYGPQTGTTITTHAMNETCINQTDQTGNNTVVVSDDIVAAGNGQIGTKYPDYTGRLVIIDLGLSTEQRRMCIASAAIGTPTVANSWLLTVHEDWDTNPVATTDTIHVAYDVDDIATGGASGGIGLGTKTGLYELSNTLTINSAAGLQNSFGQGLETDDGGNNIQVFILSGGYFYSGYEAGGLAVNPGLFTYYNNSATEPSWQWQSGSFGYFYGAVLWSQLVAQQWEHANGAGAEFYECKFISLSYELHLFDALISNCSISGRSATGEIIRIDAGTVINGLVLSNVDTLTTASADTTTETLTVRDALFSGMNTNLTVESNKTWNIINPVWTIDTTTQNDISFSTATANIVNEQYSLDITVAEADGTAIQNAKVLIYEGAKWTTPPTGFVSTRIFQVDELTDTSGFVNSVWTYRDFIDSGPGTSLDETQYGSLALRVDAWLYSPFIASQANDEKKEGTITLIPDVAISETTQATALSAGDGIGWNEDTYPSEIIEWDGGSGTLSVGDTITGGTSGATGVVTQIVSGNSTAGEAHLKLRNVTDFFGLGSEVLSNGSGWTADTIFPRAPINFDIWIDGNSESLQDIYDYLAAETASQTAFEKLWDSYSETNWSNQVAVSGYVSYVDGIGQTFTTGNSAYVLRSCKFYMTRTGTGHTGTAVAKLYGTSAGAPTGSPLATSDTVLPADMSAAIALQEFVFSDEYRMLPNTTYFIQFEYTTDDGSGNYFNVGTDSSTPTHSGNAHVWNGSTWGSAASYDLIFYVYVDSIGRDIHRWGREYQGRALQSGGSGFFTDHSNGQGVFIVDYGAGTAAYFTDNADNQWVPPTSVTITVTVKDTAGVAINLAQVGVYVGSGTSERTELMNKDTNASGIATESYTGTVPLDVEVRVRKASSGTTKYINYSSLQQISASGLTLAVTMREDPNNNATS